MAHHSDDMNPELADKLRDLFGKEHPKPEEHEERAFRDLEQRAREAEDRIDEKLGATGRFPDGKLADGDEGEVRFAVAADKERGLVHVDFGTPVQWFAMTAKQASDLAQLLNEKAREAEHENEIVMRLVTFRQAARAVCAYCGGRAFPDEPERHVAHGPNASGNYYHVVDANTTRLCKASSIWHIVRHEYGEEAVKA